MSGWPSADPHDQLDQAQDRIQALESLLTEALDLLLESGSWVEFDTTNWHGRAERFRAESQRFL